MNRRPVPVVMIVSILMWRTLPVDGLEPARLDVPDGLTVEVAAGPPMVRHPMFATFDDRGRLFVCENAGVNMTAEELETKLPNSIRLLEDRNGDGRFERSTIFADRLTFPMGGAWHEGALYVASPPHIWRFEDTDRDGVADRRDVLVSKFGFTGNAADIHGCIAGPDGRLYWCDGYHGHEFRDEAGKITSRREGSYLFSCRADGSDVRIHCGGGMDNPVEVDFTESGEMLGTVNILYARPRVDCLVHWLYGGAYPHREEVLSEIKITGEWLGPVHRFGHAAVSGTLRYRSGVLDGRWQDDFFVALFNSGKVVRLELEPAGATFRATQREFLSSGNRDFHPTDIVEDADGSLLVVDTGGWFYHGCPTSQRPQPDILGAIYRVRREGSAVDADPWGKRIDWPGQMNAELVALLNDTRFKVRNRAISECARRGPSVVAALRQTIQQGPLRQRVAAVWALTPIVGQHGDRPGQQSAGAGDAGENRAGQQAQAVLRLALDDLDSSVRLAACHGLALYPDGKALPRLSEMLRQEEAPLRRAAATALGRLGDAQAVPSLLAALSRPHGPQQPMIDRAEEHAIVYSLIEINDPSATRLGLRARYADTQRGALIALDQMDDGNLTAADLLPLLDTDDRQLQRVTVDVFCRHGEWSHQSADALARLLADPHSLESNSVAVQQLMKTFLAEPSVREIMGRILGDRQTPRATRDLLLAAIAAGHAVPLHASWVHPLERLLGADDPETVQLAVNAVAAIETDRFREQLRRLGADDTLPALLRVAALQCESGQPGTLTNAEFDLLVQVLESRLPSESLRAAEKIGAVTLTKVQLIRLAPLLSSAPSSLLRELFRAFERSNDIEVAKAFLTAMEDARGATGLAPHEFSNVVLDYPAELLPTANRLLDRMRAEEREKLLRLDKVLPLVRHGDPARGHALFFAEKSKCATCHTIADQGGKIGPDLTTIGANRGAQDLLESIIFPSATLVRDYEPFLLVTVDGRVLSGVIARATTDTVFIQQQTGDVLAVARDEIEELTADSVSIMPNGLEEALTETELADVVAYLLGLK